MADSPVESASVMFAFTHDVRTYLRTVLTRIQLVQGSSADLPSQDRAMLQEAITAARDIDGLLNAMTAYCEGNVPDGDEDFGLLLRGVLIERKAALREAGAEVEVVNESDAAVPAGLSTVLKALLINACRFRSKERPLRILIASHAAPGAVEIVVSDNGIGVDPAYFEKIFAPFCRLNSRDAFPGYGLGLATCRRIVEAWSGTIAAEPAPHDGLTIRITIPTQV